MVSEFGTRLTPPCPSATLPLAIDRALVVGQ